MVTKNKFALVLLSMLAFVACNLQPAHVPFPADESGQIQPLARPFKFSDRVSFQYKVKDTYSINPPKVLPLDMDKLPTKPFAFNDFKPLQAPIQQTKLDWDNMPDSMLNLDAVPSKPFVLQKSILPPPVITKAGIPKLLPNTTTGLLQFSGEEGLPGTQITASLLDKWGSTWLATEKGLCRYMGEYLYIYSFLDKTPAGNDYTITKMVLDHKGNIWIVTGGTGIYVINVSENILLHNRSNLFSGGIICDHKGMIWVTSYAEGLFVIDPIKETSKNLRKVKEFSNENALTAITEDRNHNIWLGYYDHIAIIDSGRQHLKNITKKEGLAGNIVIKFLEDSDGDMWAAIYGAGISFISLKDKTLNTINAKNGFDGMALEMVEDSRQQVWLFRRDTSYIINKQRTAIRHVLMDIKMGEQNFLGTSLIDRTGNIWLGTLNKGAIIIDTKGPLPQHLTTAEGLTNSDIWGIMEDKELNIWMANLQGINIYKPGSGRVSILGKKEGLESDGTGRLIEDKKGNIIYSGNAGFAIINPAKKTLTNYGKEQQFSSLGISKCITDSSGQLWFSTFQTGIISYNINTNTLKTCDKSRGMISNSVWDIIKDSQGNIWAGTDSGIAVINPVNNNIQHLSEKEGLCNNIVYKMIQRANGEIWAGTLKGISIINTDKFTITNLTRKEGLFPEEIYDIVEQNGTMYTGSSAGLVVIREPGTLGNKNKHWSFTNYGKREGFPYNDYNGNTGIATSSGQSWWGITPVLTVVTQEPVADTLLPQANITAINIMDHPLSFETYASLGSHLKKGDTLWNETKTAFYLKNTLPKDSGYLVSNNIYWDSTNSYYKIPVGLTLPYNQNSVNFSFNNNDIKGRDKILYRYILEGADIEWSKTSDKSSTRNYFNLGAGHYTFRVSTRGFNGLWSKPEECSFTILPPWWKTWWAYTLYVLIAATVISAYTRYRSYQLIQKNIDLEDKIKQRTNELSLSLENLKSTQAQLIQSEKMASLGELTAGIAHEIQNPLNFVNNFSEVSNELMDDMNGELDKGDINEAKLIAGDIKQNLEKITHHGKRASDIVKGMLQHSRTSTGKKEPTDINALCDEYLRLSYHGLKAKDKSFNATLKTDFDNSIGNIHIIPQDIGRVVLNLINNAFYVVDEKKKQHQNEYDPTVSVSTKKDNGKVLISVKDNGDGIPQKVLDKIFQPFFTTKPTGQGTGLGLSLSYDIIKAHGGEIKVETVEGEGSEFIIQLPAV